MQEPSEYPGTVQGILSWDEPAQQTSRMDDPPMVNESDTPASPPSSYRRFTVAAPVGDRVATDVVVYGSDIPAEPVLRLLGNLEGKRVLHLGCGAGHTSVAFALQGAKVIAVDSSERQVAAARRAAEAAETSVELHHGDLAELAFLRKDTVDLAFCAYALAEVADIDRVFRQVHRVLKPESPIVFSLPHPAYTMLDPSSGEPRLVRRPYVGQAPVDWHRGDELVTDHPRTISDVFVRLGRANFRVDTLLEPLPAEGQPHSEDWTEAMSWVPPTVIFRARKQGI